MFEELDTVVLARDIKAHGLKEGDIGSVVHVYKDGAIEVEFVNVDGKTIALLTLATSDVRSMAGNEILHTREFASL